MRIKATFSLLCFVMLLLSVRVLNVHADSCTSYLSDYLSKADAYNTAAKTRDMVRVAAIKGTPYASVPPELTHLEDEYNSDPSGFYKTIEGMGVGMPGYISGPLSHLQLAELRQALSNAESAYNTAMNAYKAAKKALEKCQGMTVVTIWCERGVDCRTPPGVPGNPKAHYNSKCPNYLRGGFNLAVACSGKWWSCEGVGQCPKRWSHLSSEEVAKSQIVVSTTPTPPSDSTPNCQDCTSHCSSPCSCSNSGTCNGTVSYHACDVHETSVSGDHSLQASCTSTDANGNYCTVTSFYACDSHTHSYPSSNNNNNGNSGNSGNDNTAPPPPTPTPPPEPEPTPPPPTTVACGRSGCTGSVSSSEEHRVGPCLACSDTYWSCGPNAASKENRCRLRTCRRSACGQSWRNCSGGKPATCLANANWRCWAQ